MKLKEYFLFNNLMEVGNNHPILKLFLPTFFFLKKQVKNVVFRKSFYFEIVAAEHCNLQCAMCSHYSSVAQSRFLDLDELDKDLTRMKDLFNGFNLTCCILGGEPLLHPQIPVILKKCRQYLPKARLQICTNGILLSKMNDEFWNVMREAKVELIVSVYPINLDYDEIMRLAEKKGLKEVVREQAVDKGFVKNIINHKPGNAKYNSIMCDAHHRSHTLSHGKLYTCHCSANIHIFNQYFDENFPEENGIDIHEAKNLKTVLRHVKKPCSLCSYCRPDKFILQPWEHSSKQINEWLDE